MKTLRRFLLRRFLTPAQLALIEAPCARVLNPQQLEVVIALDRPDRWMPDEPLTPEEGEAWEKILLSPVGRKVDLALCNWAQQQAQYAIAQPAHEVLRAAGFARGCRAGWEMAKTLSRLVAAQGDQSEEFADTAGGSLERHQP